MTDFASGSASIADLYSRIKFYQGSPVRIAQATLDFFDEVMNNQVDVVDATNPFIMLLESSAAHTALAVNESLLLLRKSYVGLAETEQDIYRHMTDSEYIGRFAIPGSADYTFMIDYTNLINEMVEDPLENCTKAIIPRDTFITVDSYVFTLQYPIVIRRYPNNIIQITYDTEIKSPISTPSNNIIPFTVRVDAQGMKLLYFKIPIKQMTLTSTNFAIQRESVFKKDIQFTDDFVFARVFQKNNTNTSWTELYTTHSDQVFNSDTPTAVFQVTTNNLNVTIPFIYNTRGTVSGQIRIDIYTTKGEIDVNLGNYVLDNYSIKFRNIDSIRDDNVYSTIWPSITCFAFSDQLLTGGTNAVSFDTIKKKVINYSFGNFNIPITNAQLDTVAQLNGFNIIRNADALTNRYLLGTRSIPNITIKDTSTNSQKLLNRANLGIIRFSAAFSELQSSDNVINNNGRLTLLSNSAFTLVNGQATLASAASIDNIKTQSSADLVNTVNSSSYAYTPYYYVFELESSLLNVRPYDLDRPDSANLNFVLQNTTLMLPVNTGSYAIAKTTQGYRLTIVTVSGSAYKQLNDTQVAAQLRLTNEDGTLTGTINGIQQGLDADSQERIYTFDIETSYDINENHSFEVINAYNENGLLTNFYISLETIADILYTTTSLTTGFINDETDTLINKTQLPSGSVGNTHDTVKLFFGQYLKHLWARSRTFASGLEYQTSPTDVPAIYEYDIYYTNTSTGSLLFFDGPGKTVPTGKKLYYSNTTLFDPIGQNGDYYINTTTNLVYGPKASGVWPTTSQPVVNSNEPNYHLQYALGDPVLDSTGAPVYKYRAGDTILDSSGNPVTVSALTAKNEFDIFVLDGSLLFTTDPNYISYKDQIVKTVTNWIINDILEVQARLIERTEIFFYPEASLGVTEILVDGTQTTFISSEQSLKIAIYLDAAIINDDSVKATISDTISTYLDDNIGRTKFTVNQLENELCSIFGKTVYGITISGLGGDADYKSVTVTDQYNRLCIKRKLVNNTDNTITIKPDLNFVFIKF